MPTNPDIRRRCVQLLMENQPNLTPVKIYAGNSAEQTAIVELAYSIDQVRFRDLFGINLSDTTPTILPESKWKPRLANSQKDVPIMPIKQIPLNKYRRLY